jgi:hypothetical protein
MKIKTIIKGIHKDLEEYLPVLFQVEGVKKVDHFTIGYPSNQEQTFCCIRIASLQNEKQFEFIIHLALPGVSELESYGYMQAVIGYFDKRFNQSAYGFDTVDYELQIIESDFTKGDGQILFGIMMSRVLDDCD